MKKTMKSRKKSVFQKFIKILMAGLMVFGVMQIPGQSINADNVVHAMDAEAKASFDEVTVKDGAKISLGGQFATYVGNETLLSDKTSAKVAGDTTGIESGSNAVWNSYYSKDRANAMGVLSQNGLPSIDDINEWKNNIPGVGASYWLNDTNTASIPGREAKYDISVPVRAQANGNNALPSNEVKINGQYKASNSSDSNNGGLFIDRKLQIRDADVYKDLESYINVNPETLVFDSFIQKGGYYRDIFGDAVYSSGRIGIVFPNFRPNDGTIEQINGFPMNVGALTLPSGNPIPKERLMLLYATPDCKPEDQRIIEYSTAVPPKGPEMLIYDKESDTYRAPYADEIIPVGTILAYVHGDRDQLTSLGYKYISKLLDKSGLQPVGGKLVLGNDLGSWVRPIGGTKIYKSGSEDSMYLLYHKTLREYKAVMKEGYLQGLGISITDGFVYVPSDKNIPSTTLTGATNTVRPKMTLDTSKIKFARDSSHSNTSPSPNLGAMPTTTLANDGNYKLVLNNDSLNLDDSPIKKGTKISAIGGTAPKGSVTQNNVITVTPGTTQITIPLVGKRGGKFSAISTKKDGSKAYGVVGSEYDGNVTINIADLMDTKVGQSKTITLFNEKHNDARNSDEISTTGLEITVKVENPQTIDFTQTTKDLLLDTTFSDKDTFEVNAQVTDKGIEALADTKTPITFTADASYLVQVGTTKWDETSLIATATFKVVQSQKAGVTDDKYKITINRAGTDTNDPAPQVVSTKVETQMRTYNISYDLNAPSGETPTNSPDNNKLTYTVEDTVTIKPPSLTGYTFSGWTEEVTKDGKTLDGEAGTSNADKSIIIKKGSIGDREYTAKWDINKYNITIDPNGGTYQGSTTNTIITGVNYKDTRTILDPIPSLGKTFKGWQLNAGSDAYFNADDANELIMGSGNVTLTANYDDELYEWKLDKNGSTGTQGDITKSLKMGHTETLPAGTGYARYGFAFNGWNTQADGSGTHYDAGAAFTMPATNKTLYVEWQERYNIEYVKVFAKSSWIGSEPTEAQKTNRTHFPNEDEWPKLEMKGYTFKGWSKKMTPSSDDDFKENQVHAGDKLTDNIRVYGYLAGNDYKVKFNANGGTGSMAEQTMNFAKNTTLSKNTLSKLGYEFKGWTTQSDGSGTVYNDGQKLVLNLDDYTKEDVQAIEKNGFALYAKWEEQEYTITYDGKTVDELNTTNPATESDKRYPTGLPSSYKTANGISFSNKKPMQIGREFLGWKIGTTIIGNNNGDVNIAPKSREGSIDFVSSWKTESITVAFYNSDDLVSEEAVLYGKKVPIQEEQSYPTSDKVEGKYKFLGWYEKNAEGAFKEIPYNFDTPVKSSLSLYARFEFNKYNVEFRIDTTSSIVKIENVEWGTVVNAPITDTFEKPYYRFTGKWYRDSNCTQEFNIKTDLIKEDTVLYAGWEKEIYTITYDKNHEDATGNIAPTTIQIGDTGKVYSANGFNRAGYVFYGWNTERDATGTSYKEGDPIQTDAPESKTLYAQWVQEAKAFVEIPKTIQLSDGKKDTDDADKAIKTESIKIYPPSDSTMLLPDKDIIIRTKNGFSLTMTSSTSKYDVQVYKTMKQVDSGGGETQIDEIYGSPIVPGDSPIIPSDALVTLNAKNENKKIGYFTLKTPKDGFKSKGIYTGIMTFHIQYESETQTTESK